MKKNVLIAIIAIVFTTLFTSCSDSFKEESSITPTFQKKSGQEYLNLFIFSSEKISFLKSIDFEFFLFPDSYIIFKLSKDPSMCDYGYVKMDSELGKRLKEDIYSEGEDIYYVERFGPDKDRVAFDEWNKRMIEEGLLVATHKDKYGNYWGTAYTEEEWANRNKK